VAWRGVAWRGVALVAGVVWLMPLDAQAEPRGGGGAGLLPADDPAAIINGTTVPECAWAPVVELFSKVDEGGDERCSGTYVGGRVVLTASHCVTRGFSLPVVSGTTCTDASDCPSVDEYGNVIELDCDPVDPTLCTDPDLSYSNKVAYAQFGESYPRNVSTSLKPVGSEFSG
jgi:hypothetical protein